MKRVLIAVLVALLLLSGCGEKEEETPERFELEYRQNYEGTYSFCYFAIIRDTETGVEYFYVRTGDGAGLTKLEGTE